MRRRDSKIRLPFLLLVICAVLAWTIFRQLEIEPQLEANAYGTNEAPKTVPELPPEIHFNAPPIEDLQAVLERPVFAPNRRSPSEVVAEAPVPKTFDFALKGIVIDGDERIAVFLPNAKGKVVRLREGDQMQGWTLMQVEVDHVVLARGDRETVLEPSYERAAPKRHNRRQNNGQN